MSCSMASRAGALCTDFKQVSQDKGKTNQANCNTLLQAAGKCGKSPNLTSGCLSREKFIHEPKHSCERRRFIFSCLDGLYL